MRVSTSALTALAVIFPAFGLAQNTDNLSSCVVSCGDYVSGCAVQGADSMCGCFDDVRPDKDAADCLTKCAEDAGLDPADMYFETCDAIFEDEDDSSDDDSSPGDGKSSPSPTRSESPSETDDSSESDDSSENEGDNSEEDGDSDETDDPDAAVAHGAPVLMVAGGLVAALIL